MSEFSDMLEKHILNAGLAESQLARITDFSRSYIARLKNGQRVSPDTEKMTRLFDALNLTAADYNRLWNLYMKERLGKEKYDLTGAVLEFISSFRLGSKLPFSGTINYCIPEVRLVEGSSDIGYLVKLLIGREASAGGHLRLLVQPECTGIEEALKSGFKINEKFRVEQLVCLENQEEERYYNIKILKMLVPVILCREGTDYHVRYYYDRISAHFGCFSLMPYFIITGEYVMNIDCDFEHAILYKEDEVREFLTHMFDEMKERCEALYEPFPDATKPLFHCTRCLGTESDLYYIGFQPCWGQERWDDLLKSGRRVVSYFTDQGVRRLLEEGRLEIVPGNVQIILDSQDRKQILRELIWLSGKGCCELHMIDSKKYRYPQGLAITAYDFNDVALYYNTDYGESRFILKERILAKLFYDFLECFRESAYVLSEEETVEYLKKML